MASLAVQPSSALAAVTGGSKRPASPAPETQQQQQQQPPSKEARTDREPRLHAVTCCYVVPVTSATDAHFKLCRMRDYNETLSEGLLNNGYGFHQVNLALVRARGDGYPLDGAMFRWRDPCRPDDEPKSGWVDDLTHVLFSPDYETPALWFRWVMPSSIRDESEPPSPMMQVISDFGGVLASAVYAQVKFLGKTHKDLTGFKAGVTTDFIEEAVQLMQRTLASLCRHKSEAEAELQRAEAYKLTGVWAVTPCSNCDDESRRIGDASIIAGVRAASDEQGWAGAYVFFPTFEEAEAYAKGINKRFPAPEGRDEAVRVFYAEFGSRFNEDVLKHWFGGSGSDSGSKGDSE